MEIRCASFCHLKNHLVTCLLVVCALLCVHPCYAQKDEKQSDDPDDHIIRELGDGLGELGNDFNSAFKQMMGTLSTQEENAVHLMRIIYGSLAGIAVAFIVLVVYMVLQMRKNKRIEQVRNEQFKKTFALIYDTHDGDSSVPAQTDDETQKTLELIAQKCVELGEQIDVHTNRKDNSKNVSELVFKVARRLGIGHQVAVLYFCAALVYDAGFLDIPGDLFMIDILSAEERKLIKQHVLTGAEHLSFIPPSFLPIILDAMKHHHENMNGSGYPEGMQSESIPQIARIIRVVESYISLISHRTYHKIYDKGAALAELRRQPGIYDVDIIEVLETVV